MQVHRGQEVVLVNEKSTEARRLSLAQASKAESIGNRINSFDLVVWLGAHVHVYVMHQLGDSGRVCTLLNVKDRTLESALKRKSRKPWTRRGMKTRGFWLPLK